MRERVVKGLLVVAGTISLALGIAGIFLPLLPTTPFLLLASACFLRSSARLHGWLLGHRMLGPYIRAFEEGRGLPLRAKVVAIAMLWGSMAYAAWHFGSALLAVALFAIGAPVTVYLVRLPTLRARR